MVRVLKDSFKKTLPTDRKRTENGLTFSAFFLDKHCILDTSVLIHKFMI